VKDVIDDATGNTFTREKITDSKEYISKKNDTYTYYVAYGVQRTTTWKNKPEDTSKKA
jgi:hypothetical protein